MVRVKGVRASDEEYEEWLGRLEEEEPLPNDWDTFQAMLKGELLYKDGTRLDYTDTQIAELWKTKGGEPPYEDYGVKQVTVHYTWGTELRYTLQGAPGLWSWESAIQYMEGQGWKP